MPRRMYATNGLGTRGSQPVQRLTENGLHRASRRDMSDEHKGLLSMRSMLGWSGHTGPSLWPCPARLSGESGQAWASCMRTTWHGLYSANEGPAWSHNNDLRKSQKSLTHTEFASSRMMSAIHKCINGHCGDCKLAGWRTKLQPQVLPERTAT